MANELKLGGPLVVGSASSDPGTGYNGEIYYNTTSNKFRKYENGAWSDMNSGSLAGQALNQNNIIVGNGSNISAAVNTSSVGDVLADSSTGLTVKSSAVTNAKLANMAAHTLKGNSSGSSAAPSDLTVSQVNTMLGDVLADGSVPFAADQSMGNHKLTNLAAPTTNGDALRYDQLGANNGIATLDGGGKVPVSQLPNSVMEYQGAWDPTTNTPTLADGTGNVGDVYRASVAGGATGSWTDPSMLINFGVGDFVIYNGSVWQRSPAADAVSMVNGQTGAVTVNAINELTGEVTAGPASGSQSAAATVLKDPAGAIGNGGSGLKVNVDSSTTQISSNNVAVKLDTGATSGNIVSTGSGLKNKLEASNPTLKIASNELGVKLDSGGAVVTGANGIAVNVDNSTIDISGNALEVKAGGISNTQVNASANIALSKLASLVANRVAVTDASGKLADNSSSATALVSDSLQRGKSGSALVTEEYLDSSTLTDNTSSPTSITAFQFAHASFVGQEITYTISNGAGTPDIRMGTMRIVSNGVSTSVIDSFTETADCGVTFSVSISGANTLLNYTTTSQGANRTLRADRKLFRK